MSRVPALLGKPDDNRLTETHLPEVARKHVQVGKEFAVVSDLEDGLAVADQLPDGHVAPHDRPGDPRPHLVTLEALVVLDDGDHLADRNRVAEALPHLADDSRKARGDLGNPVLVRDESAGESERDA